MDVLVNEYSTSKSALFDILLSLDVYYGYYDTNPDICLICHSLYIPEQPNNVSKNVYTINACREYAQNNVRVRDVLTALDLIKIDKSIKTANKELLTDTKYSNNSDRQIEIVWGILHDLYGPKHQYPLLLESAIACYRLLTVSNVYSLNLQTIAILLSTLYQNNLAFHGLYRQWTVSTPPQLNIVSLDVGDALIHILNIFQQMWIYTTKLIRELNSTKEKLLRSNQVSERFCRILTENFCIRNQDVSEKLLISPKTTIKHLKKFEQEKVIYSRKSGREIFYFNNILLDLLKQITEVSNNGSEKS